MSFRVLLADDHHLVRAGIRALVTSFNNYEIVAEAGDGIEALQLLRQHKPDIALLDIAMPGLNGLEVTAAINKVLPCIQVIILSMHSSEVYVNRALRAGAAGYILKGAFTGELEQALDAVGRGEKFISSAVSHYFSDPVNVMVKSKEKETDEVTRYNSLPLRQRQVLQMIAEGLSTKEIAKKMTLSPKTVKTYRVEMMSRLQIHDVAGLVRFAIRSGLVIDDVAP
jgi:DNA-binding NarL/FixJ family response regulator